MNLWRMNQPFTTALVTTLTTVDQVVQKADPMVEQVVALSGEFAQIGNEIGGEQMDLAGPPPRCMIG